MKIKLIMLKDPIMVSDEEMKDDDGSWISHNGLIFKNEKTLHTELVGSMKIIAGFRELPQIDWNGLEEEFGWVDVEEMIETLSTRILTRSTKDWELYKNGVVKGFKKAQELNEKKFSLEDMQKCWRQAIASSKSESRIVFIEDFIKTLLEPKVFDIEVEMEMKGVGCEAYRCNHPLDPEEWTCDSKECEDDCKMLKFVPKTTEGKIKIIKKL